MKVPSDINNTTTATTLLEIITIIENIGIDSQNENDGKVVNDEIVYWFHVLLYFGLNGTISIIGMCANIVNIIVFLKQGVLSDSSNTTLLGLAFADFWCLLTIFWTGVCFLVFQEGPNNLDWDPEGVMLMSAGWPHVMFSQIACWITAYLAFERCICVAFPFKVKTMFSAKQSLIVVISIFVFTILCYAPVFATHPLTWVDDPSNVNGTIISIKFMPYNQETRDASNYFNSLICRTVSILAVFICTKITVSKVNSSKKWRQSVTNPGTNLNRQNRQKPSQKMNNNSDHTKQTGKSTSNTSSANVDEPQPHPAMSQKETRLVRMITTICLIFLICYSPDIVLVFTRASVSTIHFKAKHHNLFIVMYLGSFLTEAVNSSINILVYYRLSTRYRQQFRRLFRLKEK